MTTVTSDSLMTIRGSNRYSRAASPSCYPFGARHVGSFTLSAQSGRVDSVANPKLAAAVAINAVRGFADPGDRLDDPIYRRRRFPAETIELCVRWYITYRLNYFLIPMTRATTPAEACKFTASSSAFI